MQETIHRLVRTCRDVICRGLAGSVLALGLAACGGDYPQSTIGPATDLAGHIHDLYVQVFWWTMFILAVVSGVLTYVLVRYRERPGAETPRQTRGHLGLEIAWTVAPAVIVVLITIPTIRAVFRTQQPPASDALAIEVIGHQWWWEFRYPELGVVTANELHLPVGRPVDLSLRSADVIHSFWVPRLGGKRDVNPSPRVPEGRTPKVNRLTFTVSEPGVYHGQCAEFCGASHALMRMQVVVESAEAFASWAEAMKTRVTPTAGTPEDRGREIFARSPCVACHAIAGTTAQGAVGPSLTRVGARSAIAAGVLENTTENLVRWITDPASVKPGALMPGTAVGGGGFPPTGLSPEDAGAVAAYLRSLR
ncbi:MAG: cytochrome c oxidase subunit II [Gemmatimonadetes bacterium]|nr:cytochrome c oxidase subunit II [Gemmatimonadota bacterium]